MSMLPEDIRVRSDQAQSEEHYRKRGVGTWVTWGWWDLLLGGVGVLLILLLVLFVVLLPVGLSTDEDSEEVLIAQAVAQIFWYFGIVGFVHSLVKRRGSSWRELGLRPPRQGAPVVLDNPWWSIVTFAVVMYFASIMLVAIYNGIVSLLGFDSLLPSQQVDESTFDSTLLVVLTGIAVVIGAPIAEELFFRGFLFAGLRRQLPLLVAGVSSGFLFSLAHGQIGLVIPFTLVGFMLAYSYERMGSLYASMTVHFIFNTISFLVLVFLPDAR